MTAKELAGMVGVEGTIRIGGMIVNVRVLDVKESYGRLRYQVTPLAGEGEVWTEGFFKNAKPELATIRRVG